MGNTVEVPSVNTDSVEVNFGNYLKVATADTGDSYNPDDLQKAQKAAKLLSDTLVNISGEDTLPSDRTHKLNQFERALPKVIEDLKKENNVKYDALIETEREALYRLSLELQNVQEIRSNFAELVGDPVAMQLIIGQLDDNAFEVLRLAPDKPIIEKKNGLVSSVALKSYISPDLEESELRRRRPNIATRLDVFASRKASFVGIANTLGGLLKDRLASLSRGF